MESSVNISKSVLNLIHPDQAWDYQIIPFQKETSGIKIWIAEDAIFDGIQEELHLLLGEDVELFPNSTEEVKILLAKYYRRQSSQKSTLTDQQDFLATLIEEAKNLDSSDIHIEKYENTARVRIRIDGKLIERYEIPGQHYLSFINKIKIKANLDIAEKRLPQDGRIHVKNERFEVDIRVSVLPTLHGEKVVMRLLNNDATNIDIHKLGLSNKDLRQYLEGVKKPHGIVLISGPTGSGKTTTLYATLKLLNKEETNVVTVEDPIEYTLEGINQVQLKENIGLTFAAALKSFLRQDPDVIMLGEIRDGETAQMAIRAAMTGHLVLSTIHTNSAWGTIGRLMDMGVPSYLIAATLNTSVAQRLVRKLCPSCKEEKTLDTALYPLGYNAPRDLNTHFVPTGCDACHYTGYQGRMAIYEIIGVDQEIKEQIKNKTYQINDMLQSKGYQSLANNAFELFAKGTTSLEEVYAILMN